MKRDMSYGHRTKPLSEAQQAAAQKTRAKRYQEWLARRKIREEKSE